jgi:hypothetical protein
MYLTYFITFKSILALLLFSTLRILKGESFYFSILTSFSIVFLILSIVFYLSNTSKNIEEKALFFTFSLLFLNILYIESYYNYLTLLVKLSLKILPSGYFIIYYLTNLKNILQYLSGFLER